MSLIEYIQHHPVVAFTIGAIHLTASIALQNFEIPSVVMQLFQLGAWTVTILVGLISIYGAYKKRKRNNEPKKY